MDALRVRPVLLCIAVTGLMDAVWIGATGLTFTGWRLPVLAALFLLTIAAFYSTLRPVPRLAELASYGAGWIVLSLVGGVGTYIASSAARPLQDEAFALLDASLGFDWVAWSHFVRSHSALTETLRFAYASFMPQIVFSLTVFAFMQVPGRNHELLLAAWAALLATCLVSAVLPAMGPWVHFGFPPLLPSDVAYVPHVLALRKDTPPAFVLTAMQGIVCCPSYHSVMAILLTYAHRGLRWSLPPVAVLNGLMLLSIPSEGGHYLADMLASVPVMLLALGAVRLARWSNERPIPKPCWPSDREAVQNGHSLRNTRFVKDAGPDLQQDQALRHHAPNVPGGEVSKDMMGARSAAEYKLLIDLSSVADGQSTQLRGHWAMLLRGSAVRQTKASRTLI